MEPVDKESSDYINGFRFDDDENITPVFAQTSSLPSEIDSFDEFTEYANHILVEEHMEGKPSMFYDPCELEAIERSFYEAIGENYPPSFQPPLVKFSPNVDSLKENFFGSSNEGNTHSNANTSNSIDLYSLGGDCLETKSMGTQTHSIKHPSLWSFGSTINVVNNVNKTTSTITNTHIAQIIYTESKSILQFKKGMEEARKFLPPTKSLVIDLDKYDLPSDSKEDPKEVVVMREKIESHKASSELNGGKHYHLEEDGYEEKRSRKQSAVHVEEAELSEMFDRVLLYTDFTCEPLYSLEEHPCRVNNKLQRNGHGSNNGWNACYRRQGIIISEFVHLRTLLVNCAQSIAANDHRTASIQLKQIKQHASLSGDASQRLAHVFALGLEARLVGNDSQIYAAKNAITIPVVDKLKAFQDLLFACPFKKNAISFANKMIYEATSTSSTVHIIDFGIGYGFQWPTLIQYLSVRPGGPPKLRITGIELPQPGFKPAERIEETMRRLGNYCERFTVLFEYNAIATQNWEMIKIEDLKLQKNECLVVNTLARFKNLLDETVVVDSPRDSVLKLIRDMKPDVFVQTVVNGSFNAPFFVTRFREALFHYSALFDMFDTTMDRKNKQRLNFEKELFGCEAMNVIASEGSKRVERPETYKQWQVRNSRAGFKLKPLNLEFLSIVKANVKEKYHKDFLIDDDGKWMLQGWKGRILYASSCWVPAKVSYFRNSV